MTLDEALAVCDRAKPNQYSRSEKIRWLSDADGLVQREILDYVEPGTFSGYDEETPGETVLLAPAPYEGLYEAYESLGEEERPEFDLVYHTVDGDSLLPADGICTDRGSSHVYGLKVTEAGGYCLTLEIKADAGKLAQIPVSVFLNGTLAGTITVNGTDGEWISVSQELGTIVFPNNYIRLYFAQSGMKIRKIRIWRKELEGEA